MTIVFVLGTKTSQIMNLKPIKQTEDLTKGTFNKKQAIKGWKLSDDLKSYSSRFNSKNHYKGGDRND